MSEKSEKYQIRETGTYEIWDKEKNIMVAITTSYKEANKIVKALRSMETGIKKVIRIE